MLPLSFAYPGASTALCGDHKQLGPVVRSAHCRSHGLAVSMLERLIDTRDAEVEAEAKEGVKGLTPEQLSRLASREAGPSSGDDEDEEMTCAICLAVPTEGERICTLACG